MAWAAVMATVSRTSPTPLDLSLGRPQTELVVPEAAEAAVAGPHLEKRLSADFCMDKSWDNEVLFAG